MVTFERAAFERLIGYVHAIAVQEQGTDQHGILQVRAKYR